MKKLIQAKDYLLFVDEEAEIKEGDTVYENISGVFAPYGKEDIVEDPIKILAHYPLTDEVKELDLPWLPNPFEKDIIMYNLLNKDIPSVMSNYGKVDGTRETSIDYNKGHRDSWIKGYKAAQSKQFSLEDMKKAIEMASTLVDLKGCYFSTSYLKNLEFDELAHLIEPKYTEEEIIQSLYAQRLPKEFIVEYKKGFRKNSDGEEIGFPVHKTVELKTITNSEGKKELVGTYKY